MVLSLVLMSMRREEISAPLTRGPRFCGVQFAKGGGKQRVLLHQIKEPREQLKVVVGGREGSSWAMDVTTRE